jgi:hypothetical protein
MVPTTAASCPANSGGDAVGHSHQLTSPSTPSWAAQAGPPPLQLHSRGVLGNDYAPLLQQQQQQLPPHQRNKAVICKSFIEGRCTTLRDECPYLHALLDEARSVPERACRYFMQGACLRGTCPFFHGTQSELKSLIRSHGASGKYTLRDLNLAVLDPPPSASLQHPPLVPPGGGQMPHPYPATIMMPTTTTTAVVLAPPPRHYAFAAPPIPHISMTDLSFPEEPSQLGSLGGRASGQQPAPNAAALTSGPSTMMTNTNLLHLQQHYAYHGRNGNRSPQQQPSLSSHHGSVLSRASSNLSAVSTGSRNPQTNFSLSPHEVDEDVGASLTSLLMLPSGEPSTSTTTPPHYAQTAAAAAVRQPLQVGGGGGGVPSHFLQAPPTMWVSPASSASSMILLHHPPHPGNSSGQYTAFSSASSFASGGSQGQAGGSAASPVQAQHHLPPVASSSAPSSAQPHQYCAMGPCYLLPGGEAQMHVGSGGLSAAQLQQHQQEYLLPSSSTFPATAGTNRYASLQQSASPAFVGFDAGTSTGGWGTHRWMVAPQPHHAALTQLAPQQQQNPAFLWLGPEQFQDPMMPVLPMRQHHQQFLVPPGAVPGSSSSLPAQANVSAFAADGELTSQGLDG